MTETTIKSTGLDFNSIKNNLKTFFKSTEEFNDYNFEASGLSNLLDVLAYNTHYNGLIANFALNESYLSTAQLRSSMVGLAGALGYNVRSQTAAKAIVRLQVTDVAGPSIYTLPSGTTFTTTVEGTAFTFQTRETYNATKDGSGNYQFVDADGNKDLYITEGIEKTKIFLAGPASETDTYVIPDESMDSSTAIIKVYNSATSPTYVAYQNIDVITTIDENTRIYVLKESPNGYYEVTFGNGSTLGISPVSGEKIEVSYLSCGGPTANGGINFTPTSEFPLAGGGTTPITVIRVQKSAGGSDKEVIESIRKNAPYLYASQNRMVTAADYSTLVLRNFGQYIDDIKAWGGEDNIPQNIGAVYLSISFKEGVNIPAQKTAITAYAKDLSVASFEVKYTDPIITYLEITPVFQFNSRLSSVTNLQAQTLVDNSVSKYFTANIGKFDQSFRRSNLLTLIDDTDVGILSSRAIVRMQQRLASTDINFTVGKDYTFTFPGSILSDLDDETILETSDFTFSNRTCAIRNRIGSNILEIFDRGSATVLTTNTGYFDPQRGIVYIQGFAPQALSGGDSYLRVSVLSGNQGNINTVRENVLALDAIRSSSSAVITTSV